MRAAFSACSAWQRAPRAAPRGNRPYSRPETGVSGMKPRGRPGSPQPAVVSELASSARAAGSVRNWPRVFSQARDVALCRARGAEPQRAYVPRRASAARQSRPRQLKSLAALAAARRRMPRRNARHPTAASTSIVRARGLRRAELVRGGAQARRSAACSLPVRLWRHLRALLRPRLHRAVVNSAWRRCALSCAPNERRRGGTAATRCARGRADGKGAQQAAPLERRLTFLGASCLFKLNLLRARRGSQKSRGCRPAVP